MNAQTSFREDLAEVARRRRRWEAARMGRTREGSTDGRAGGIAAATVQAGGQNGSIPLLGAEECGDVPGEVPRKAKGPWPRWAMTRAAALSNRASVSTAAVLKRRPSLVRSSRRDRSALVARAVFGLVALVGLVVLALLLREAFRYAGHLFGTVGLLLTLAGGLLVVATLRSFEALP